MVFHKKMVKPLCFTEDIPSHFTKAHGDCPTCVPMFVSYHPFDIANAAQVLTNPTVKLEVVERGPYVYQKFVHKQNVLVEDNKISYKIYSIFEFDAIASCNSCTELDMITTLDAGYLATMTRAGGEAAFLDTVLTAMVGTGETRNMLGSDSFWW